MPFRALTHGRVKRHIKGSSNPIPDNATQKTISNSSKGLENSGSVVSTKNRADVFSGGRTLNLNQVVEPKVVIRNKNGNIATMLDFRKRNSQGKGKRALANPMPSVGGMSKFAKRAIQRRTNLSTKICCNGLKSASKPSSVAEDPDQGVDGDGADQGGDGDGADQGGDGDGADQGGDGDGDGADQGGDGDGADQGGDDDDEPVTNTIQTYISTVTPDGVTLGGLSGWKFTGDLSGVNLDIEINPGDTLKLNIIGDGLGSYPFYIKTKLTDSQNDDNVSLAGNGASNGEIIWTPVTAGTYYYICPGFPDMKGTITVS